MEQSERNISAKKGDVWKTLSIVFAILFVIAATTAGIFIKQNLDNNQRIDETEQELRVAKNEVTALQAAIEQKNPDDMTEQINYANFLNKVSNELKSAFPDKGLGDLISIDYYEGEGQWRASTYTESAAALFYKMSNDAEWQYFRDTQAILSCKDFNTSDIKKAYGGEICYDDDGGLTNVTMYNN